ncbi:hypothetical protein [Leekyejoonella antrihumi]|uniref:GNAT family N-acetyltransferase n=1 Tax=Leekyejoonella antrihumi TaxID=1660198 RepID=A0A563DX11_9MICO|nr:hypothetical protein [Leekyejoonella antrihumi]TWP34669.1 hypothetical protein FGL98_16260 [Leekyejoonella antrihumi]
MPDIELVPIDEPVLEALIQAAVNGADADEVTPPLSENNEWTPERMEWLRAYHRACREGLDGPAGEAIWAITSSGTPVGAVRLKRTGDGDVVEAGIWLVRSLADAESDGSPSGEFWRRLVPVGRVPFVQILPTRTLPRRS